MKILLLEDDQYFTDLVSILLTQINIDSFQFTKTADECIGAFVKQADEIDLCILDIDLGEEKMDGIGVAKKIRELDPDIPIIFLTSMYNEKYYFHSKEVQPTAFLNKNLDKIALKQAIELSCKKKSVKSNPKTESVTPHTSLFVKIGDKYKPILIENVSYFSADKKMVYCHVDKRKYPLRTSLKSIESKLNNSFLRVHRSYIININQLEMVNFVSDTVNISNVSVPIGAAYKEGLLDKAIWLK